MRRCVLLAIVMLLLVGCDRGPTEADMEGCAVRGGGPPISTREVADCAVDRAEFERSNNVHSNARE